MVGEGVKEKAKILIGIDQRMVNQKDSSQIEIEAMLSEMIKESKDALDVVKRATLKETIWQKIFICITKKKQMKMLI